MARLGRGPAGGLRPAAALLLTALLVGAAPPPDPAIERVERRGLALARYDRAAWVSTDDVLAQLPVARREEVGGWIITPGDGGLHVDYFGRGASAERTIYAAGFDGRAITHPVVYAQGSAPRLSDLALHMIHALGTARAELARHPDWRPCTAAPFNTVVLPPDADGNVPVYFLTAQTETGSVPFGGHYEVNVAADDHIVSSRAFTNACLPMSAPPSPNGASPVGLFITHLLDPQPTEIHVFEQLQAHLPVYVGTGRDTIWRVENGSITRVKQSP